MSVDFTKPRAANDANGVDGTPYSVHKVSERQSDAEALRATVLDGAAIAAPLPELEYLVQELGLVAGGGAPHLLAGYGFTGKTLALQSLALAVADARPIWGAYRCRASRRVLHVDLEQGDRLTRRRYQRLAVAMGVDLPALGDALGLAVMPPITLTAAYAESWRALMTGRDLVIVDSLRAATGGQDENSSDIRAGLDMLGTLSDATGCRPIVIHHARKPSDDDPGGRYSIRGSSAIYDSADSVYLFSAAKGEPVLVAHAKARSHGELVEDVSLVISDVDVAGDPRGGLKVEVRGAEVVAERRADREQERQREETRLDAATVRKVLGARELSATDLRVECRLSGDRCRRALVHLGAAIVERQEPTGKGPAKRMLRCVGGAS